LDDRGPMPAASLRRRGPRQRAPRRGFISPMKILVISLAGIGDTLIATPFIHELRANFPDATLDAFVLWPGSKDLLEGNPHLNAVILRNLIKDGPLKSFP